MLPHNVLRHLQHDPFWDQAPAGVLTSSKSFIRWLWQSEAIENLPRNIDSLHITVDLQEVRTFTPEEIKVLNANASERTRLYLLLMLNCGMYQGDISDLKQSQVDWDKGRIHRKRSKTEREENVPKVNYLLWRETFVLLKKHRSKDGERVLVNANGSPLRQRGFREDGSNHNLDNIACAYQRTCRKLRIKTPKPLKLIRKTGATALEQHAEYGRYAQYYLGHAPTTAL
jgi:integrase